MKRVGIIGGGILGLSIGYELLSNHSNFSITIFEKESEVGQHQSGRNSGVLHCGLHYLPGSLKSKLAVTGIRKMISFCEQNDVDHEVCGKVVVASNDREEKNLDELAFRGSKNGLLGLKYLTNSELKVREPNIKASKALIVPEEGIVDYNQVMLKLKQKILEFNGDVVLNSKVISLLQPKKGEYIVETNNFEYSFDIIINCTGLFSDRTYNRFTQKESPIKIIPFRGEYLSFKNEYKEMINHLIYPVPDPTFPFLGVHFTRLISGKREVGPNAVLALKREGYQNSNISIADIVDIFGYVGFRKFLGKNFSFSMKEFSTSLSKNAFVNKAKRLMPSITSDMLISEGTSGVRAQAMSPMGQLDMDFRIVKDENQIHVLNCPSPGATASLAIAQYIVNNYVE